MLPRVNRLTSKKDFDNIFKKGKSFKGDFLIFKILKNRLEKQRVGFIVSKKVSNKATVRNKIKRMLRAAVQAEFNKKDRSADIVILVLPQAKNKEFVEFTKLVSDFFKKH